MRKRIRGSANEAAASERQDLKKKQRKSLDVCAEVLIFAGEDRSFLLRINHLVHSPIKKRRTPWNSNLKQTNSTATDKLVAYVEKKVAKLEKHENVQRVEFTLEVVKPETAKNKEARLNVVLAGHTIHAEKTADTFEEAVDLCVDVARRELAENKENHS